jgi:hypothetical protein
MESGHVFMAPALISRIHRPISYQTWIFGIWITGFLAEESGYSLTRRLHLETDLFALSHIGFSRMHHEPAA